MLIVNKTALDYHRQHRNQYEEEELLGFCSSEVNYCGASLPIHKYTVYHEFSYHIDSVYLPEKVENKKCPDCDQFNYEGILCYGF
jgi:hypothetical protein